MENSAHYELPHINKKYSGWKILAPLVERVDNDIHWMNHYPVDSVVCFIDTYPRDSDLSGA